MTRNHSLSLLAALVAVFFAPADRCLAELIVHYTFDGDAGTFVTDSADVAGGDNFGTIGVGSDFTTDQIRGEVLATGGADGLIIDSLSSATGSYTIAGWFKGTDSGYFYDQATNRFVASVEENTTNNGEGTEEAVAFWDGAWKNTDATGANDGFWHHLAWSLDGVSGTYSIYVDGVAVDLDLATEGVQTTRAATWTTLGDGEARFFAQNAGSFSQLAGLADDVRIYDNALTSSEVQTLYDETKAVYIVALSPDAEASVDPAGNLVATFTEEIALLPGGTVTLTDLDDGSGTTVITLPDPQVSVSGATLTIDPAADLEAANYEVVIDGSAVETTGANAGTFAGTAPGEWTFSTTTLSTGPAVREVAGDGTIGDEVLATDGGVATVPTQIGSNWKTGGGNGGGAPQAFSSLASPGVTVPASGPVMLSFTHRYNFEADYDGGAVFVSINDGPYTYLDRDAFTQNGYVGPVNNTVWLDGEEIFHGASAGYGWPTLIRSVAHVGDLNAGDKVSVDFRGGWDANTYPAETNWEIGTVTLEDSAGSAFLDVDFTTDGPAGFTAVTTAVNPNFPGGWKYANIQLTFEIDADALTADRLAPDVAGSVIDLNGADIVVELAAGTLDAGDEFTLFDLSGGTTLSGSPGNLVLPPGVWDSSTLAVDGRIILLVPEDTVVPTAGADLYIDASKDGDPLDGRSPDLASGSPSGFELVLDDSPVVPHVSFAASTDLPKIRSAFDMPGGLTGNDGGAHLTSSGTTNNQISFHQAPGDWSNEDVSIEIWFKPDSLEPVDAGSTNGQIIFEDGGGTGLGIFLDDSGELQLRKAGGGGIVSYDLANDPLGILLDSATAEFIQVVGSYDVNPGALTLFINGVEITPGGTDNASPGGGDWSGGDGAGIGTRGDANTGGIGGGQSATESFDGQVSIFRVYRNQLLTEAEAAANFTEISTPDTTAPTYVALSPANLSTGVFFEDSLVATFTENISLTGTGTVTLRNLDTMTDAVITLPDAGVTASGSRLTIDPAAPLAYDTSYAVLISADAVVDNAPAPNAFAGISDPTRWTFTTDPQDLTAPMVASLSPEDESTGVQSADRLVVTFDETVVIGSGDITLKNLTQMTETTIAVTDGVQVSLSGPVLTITPAAGLRSESEYAVQIAAGTVADISGNGFGGILDEATWNFTTGSFPENLFTDTFDRPNSTDLNESALGKSGLNGALDWGSGNLQSLIDINNNTMRINNNDSDGNDGAWAWVEHNFTGLSEFTVTLDIATQSSGGNGRFTGFRVGQSLADISGETNAAIGGNAADVQVYLDNVGSTRGIRIFEGATDLGYVVSSISGVGELSATFSSANMNAGTTLNYEVFLDGVSQYVGSTSWSGTDENYISVQSNSTNDTRFDSFSVTGVFAAFDYDAWAELFPGADLGDPAGDFDGDGLTNDYERLFGLDPTDALSINPIRVPLNPADGSFTFSRRDNALTGLFTDIETSTDLVNWTVDAGAVVTETGPPDAAGVETVAVTLSAGLLGEPRLFVRVNQNDDGTLYSEDFEGPDGEGTDGGFTPTGAPNDWERGTPASDNQFNLQVTAGNGDSANCWATNLATGTSTPPGAVTPSVDSILRSPDIDLTGVAGAELSFAAVFDAAGGDEAEVLVKDAGTDALLATILPFGDIPLANEQTSDWMSYGPFDLSTAVGATVYLEFRFKGTSSNYLGLYIDDVSVSEVIVTP